LVVIERSSQPITPFITISSGGSSWLIVIILESL
jgi:hypothetical protein